MKLILLLSLFINSVLYSNAQVFNCVDVRQDQKERAAMRGVFDFNNKWTPGTILTISYLNGTHWQKDKVKQYAVEWLKYANVQFQFLNFGTGHIRISFSGKASYSYIGTDAKSISSQAETMNLGWIDTATDELKMKAVILHEFGHALGLLHEHMNPLSNIHWNKPVVYAWYLQYNGWDKNMVDRQVFDRYTVTMTNKQYDPLSIMHYSIPANFTTDGYSVAENDQLSDSDKKIIAELYPFNKLYPAGNRSKLWSRLQELAIDFNAEQNGVKGILIKQKFEIFNSREKTCTLAAYFYNAENSSPLMDQNQQKRSANGQVAASITFKPAYVRSVYKSLSLFMPYSELELGTGIYKLKCYVAIFDDELNLVVNGGYQYFSYANGAVNK